MHITEACIRRPVMTSLLSFSAVLLGWFAFQKLPVAALPSFDTPVINVTASFPGASPEIMAATVAAPLEKQFSIIDGISTTTSSSSLGSTSVVIEFDEKHDINQAALDVQAALLRAQRLLPLDMTSTPDYRKVNPADQPVLILGLSSPSLPLSDLNDFAETLIAPSLSIIEGVAQVSIMGQKKYSVRIAIDPERLAGRNLSLSEVAAALKAANTISATGTLQGARQRLMINLTGTLRNAQDFARLPIAWRSGAAVRLGDVADVQDSVQTVTSGAWLNGESGLILAIYRQPDANTVAVVDRVRATLPRLALQLPGSIRIDQVNDRSKSVRESIHDVNVTLLLTAALVILVIFLFLRRASATLIPALTLPISLVITFALMAWMGSSLNNISLLGLTLAVGLVVDDAIVVIENITRHLEAGMNAFDAAILGAKEVAFTILSISLSLVAVFIPIFFMPGTIGQLFHEFALTVTLAILVSALASLTLIPMLCARFLKGEHSPNATDFNVPLGTRARGAALRHILGAPLRLLLRGSEAGFDAMFRFYRVTLDWALTHRRSMMLVTLSSLVLTIWQFAAIPKGFFPEEDTGLLFVSSEAALDVSFEEMRRLQKQAEAQLRSSRHVAFIASFTGGDNTGRFFITLKDRSERPPMAQVVNDLRRLSAGITGLKFAFNPIQNLRLGGRPSKARYQYTLQSVRASELDAWAQKLLLALRDDEVLRDLTSDSNMAGQQVALLVNRDRAAELGVDIATLTDALYGAFGERQISTIYTEANQYPVIMLLADAWRGEETRIENLTLRSKSGALVPIASFASVARRAAPVSVNHQGQLQAVTLTFNIAPGAALGEALAHIEAARQNIAMPPTILAAPAGEAAAFQKSQSGQLSLLLLALAVIYVLLGVLYESTIHPITILAGIPSAAFGALITLRLFNVDLTMIAAIGILMLIGIVKKNAIMMVDFAVSARQAGERDPVQAIRQACLLRFRPIMMTSFAALMGALPIALGLGAGSELRQPLGLAVVGGLVISQAVTLYITPALYLFFDRLGEQIKGWLAN